MQQLLDAADNPHNSATPDTYDGSLHRSTSLQPTDPHSSATPDTYDGSLHRSTSMQPTDPHSSAAPDTYESNTQIDLPITPTMCSSPIQQFEHDTLLDYDISLTQESTLKGSEYVPGESSQDSLDTTAPDDSANGGKKSQNHWPGSSNVREKSFVITESHLKQLLALIPCPFCMSKIHKSHFQECGSCVGVKLVCQECEAIVLDWQSQPFEGKMPLFNLLFSASIVFSGSTFETFSKCASFSGLQIINRNSFFQVQRNLVVPAINHVYRDEIDEAQREVKEEGSVVGDGRFDSPGKSAKYCTYSFQSVKTRKIISSSTVQTKSGKGSAPLEMEGFINCLADLKDKNIPVDKITTDRNKQIAKWLRENRKNIKHRYDPWHFAKNITSKLRPIAKKKDCTILEEWIKPVGTHLFYCSENCGGDGEKLVAMWKSLLHHVSNRHTFKRNKLYPKCDHGKLSREKARKKKWIKPGTPAYMELEKVISDEKLIKDMPQVAGADHTGNLEVFHSVLLSYAPKRLEFDNRYMSARVKLAILDYNENVGRGQAVIKKSRKNTGAVGELRYNFKASKRSGEWVAKEVKDDKTFKFIEKIWNEVFRLKLSGVKLKTPAEKDPAIPKNIAKTPMPVKNTVLAKRLKLTRFAS